MLPWLSSSIQRRIWPGLYLVGAACRTTARGCVSLCWVFGGRRVGGGVFVGGEGAIWAFGGTGIAFAPVAGCFPLSLVVVCCVGGGMPFFFFFNNSLLVLRWF